MARLLLLNLILIITAISLAVFLLYESGGSIEDLRALAEGKSLSESRAERHSRMNVLRSIKKATEAVGSAAAAISYDHYADQTPEGAARGLSVLMYHTVYDPMDPPQQTINDNYISTYNLEEELKYLTDEGYSFPDWEAVRRYIDGEIDLPEKSVVLTFDDGTDGFRKYGVPLLKKYNVPATAFIIVSKNGEKWVEGKDDYPDLDLESHSYDMHRPGGRIGHGGIMTALTQEQIVEDLKMSQTILGNSNAFAYPFGDVDQIGTCRNAVEEAGFLVAFTTQYGKVYPGRDPYLLPRMRVNGRNSLEAFKTLL